MANLHFEYESLVILSQSIIVLLNLLVHSYLDMDIEAPVIPLQRNVAIMVVIFEKKGKFPAKFDNHN